MRRFALSVALSALSALFAFASASFAAEADARAGAGRGDPLWDTASLATTVSVTAGSQERTVLARVEIADAATGRVLASPVLVLPTGETGEVVLGNGRTSYRVAFDVDAAGQTARYSATLTRSGKVEHMQKSTLAVTPRRYAAGNPFPIGISWQTGSGLQGTAAHARP